LQCGHGLTTVENAASGRWTARTTSRLQCGHGLTTVENSSRCNPLAVQGIRPCPRGVQLRATPGGLGEEARRPQPLPWVGVALRERLGARQAEGIPGCQRTCLLLAPKVVFSILALAAPEDKRGSPLRPPNRPVREEPGG